MSRVTNNGFEISYRNVILFGQSQQAPDIRVGLDAAVVEVEEQVSPRFQIDIS